MGILSGLIDKFAAHRQRSKDKAALFASILAAASDGKLTDAEMEQIKKGYTELGLTRDDLASIKTRAYAAALLSSKKDGVVTAAEEAELSKLQRFLMIDDSEIAKSKLELARLRLLTEIQEGNLPAVEAPNVILQKRETPHWSEPGSILEERVVSRRYEGGSHGVSIRIMKGVSYRIGAQRGQLVTDKAVLPVSSGDLVLTSKRVIFRGDRKSFTIKLEKLLEMQMYSDGVRLTDGSGKPRTVQFDRRNNTDIVGAILSQLVNQVTAEE